MKSRAVVFATIAFLSAGIPARAALAPDVRCESGKLKTVASYASCRLKAEAKGLIKMLSPDFAPCESKITSKFPKLEEQAGVGVCPSEMDLADIKDRSDDFTTTVAILLAGGSLPMTACGDGTIDLGEQCDVGDLDGETCATRGFFNGTLACGPGCMFDETGCNADRFVDTGTTIIDHQTELEWEKKDSLGGGVNAANPHDADNTYTWCTGAGCTTMQGTLFTAFQFGTTGLNGVTNGPPMPPVTTGCFDGRCDWRVPTIDELKTIAVPGCGVPPCVIDPLFLPAISGNYWSVSTSSPTTGAYFMNFSTGSPAGNLKTTAYHARAVRSTE